MLVDTNSRSNDPACRDGGLVSCNSAVVDPAALLSGGDLDIGGFQLSFIGTVHPNGYVYRTTGGDEAVITYNSKTKNMFARYTTLHTQAQLFISFIYLCNPFIVAFLTVSVQPQHG